MTTIRRKYSLPNCTLFVEGLSEPQNEQSSQVRPVMSMLVNAECHIAGAKPLTGGKEFFESLVNSVSGYAQEFLSKVPHSEAHNNSGLVQLQQIDRSRHRLIVLANAANHSSELSQQVPIAVELTTVQLFDLVEAVDQFFADSQTIPTMALQLAPVSKRYAGHTPQLTKQAVPAAIGVSSLALAAIAFFFVPIPEVRRPEELQPQSRFGSGDQVVRAITDTAQIASIQQNLYNRIHSVWNRSVEQDLVYRVSASDKGAIIGYRALSALASDAIEQTPLPELLVYPVSTDIPEALADFQVVFRRDGILQVSPWR